MYFRPPKIKLPKFTIRPKLPVRPPVPNPPKPTLPLESMKAAGDHALKELGEKIVEHYKEHEEHKEQIADKELLKAIREQYKKDQKFKKHNADEYLNKANILRDLKRSEEAIAAYEQALRLDPTLAYVYNNKVLALINLNRNQEALAAYNEALRLDQLCLRLSQ